jgi:hypothetical protein
MRILTNGGGMHSPGTALAPGIDHHRDSTKAASLSFSENRAPFACVLAVRRQSLSASKPLQAEQPRPWRSQAARNLIMTHQFSAHGQPAPQTRCSTIFHDSANPVQMEVVFMRRIPVLAEAHPIIMGSPIRLPWDRNDLPDSQSAAGSKAVAAGRRKRMLGQAAMTGA